MQLWLLKGPLLLKKNGKKDSAIFFKHFKGDEVIVRLPGFDSYFDVADLGSKKNK